MKNVKAVGLENYGRFVIVRIIGEDGQPYPLVIDSPQPGEDGLWIGELHRFGERINNALDPSHN